jgi:tripartite-type tricarboxylate transporter receptor subunit TctC
MWAQPVIVESKPGGNGGWIAVEYVKKAQPDGYTYVLVDSALFSIHPHLYKKMPYDPLKDFAAVAPVFSTNYFIAVKSESKWTKVSDIIDAAKAAEGKIKYATGGVGGTHHLGSAILETATGTKMTHVPYKDTTQIYVDIASGDIDWAFTTAATAKPFYDSKKVKFLALAAPARNPNFPDVPTIVEAGGPDMELRTWVGLFAPTGTPKEAIDRVTNDIAKVMTEPEVKQRLDAIGFQAWSGAAADLKSALDADYKKYGDVLSKITIDIQ